MSNRIMRRKFLDMAKVDCLDCDFLHESGDGDHTKVARKHATQTGHTTYITTVYMACYNGKELKDKKNE